MARYGNEYWQNRWEQRETRYQQTVFVDGKVDLLAQQFRYVHLSTNLDLPTLIARALTRSGYFQQPADVLLATDRPHRFSNHQVVVAQYDTSRIPFRPVPPPSDDELPLPELERQIDGLSRYFRHLMDLATSPADDSGPIPELPMLIARALSRSGYFDDRPELVLSNRPARDGGYAVVVTDYVAGRRPSSGVADGPEATPPPPTLGF